MFGKSGAQSLKRTTKCFVTKILSNAGNASNEIIKERTKGTLNCSKKNSLKTVFIGCTGRVPILVQPQGTKCITFY
jgi:hypothetical protein